MAPSGLKLLIREMLPAQMALKFSTVRFFLPGRSLAEMQLWRLCVSWPFPWPLMLTAEVKALGPDEKLLTLLSQKCKSSISNSFRLLHVQLVQL